MRLRAKSIALALLIAFSIFYPVSAFGDYEDDVQTPIDLEDLQICPSDKAGCQRSSCLELCQEQPDEDIDSCRLQCNSTT